jgi:hypothetical protein
MVFCNCKSLEKLKSLGGSMDARKSSRFTQPMSNKVEELFKVSLHKTFRFRATDENIWAQQNKLFVFKDYLDLFNH